MFNLLQPCLDRICLQDLKKLQLEQAAMQERMQKSAVGNVGNVGDDVPEDALSGMGGVMGCRALYTGMPCLGPVG